MNNKGAAARSVGRRVPSTERAGSTLIMTMLPGGSGPWFADPATVPWASCATTRTDYGRRPRTSNGSQRPDTSIAGMGAYRCDVRMLAARSGKVNCQALHGLAKDRGQPSSAGRLPAHHRQPGWGGVSGTGYEGAREVGRFRLGAASPVAFDPARGPLVTRATAYFP